jgi:type IV pilus assembly PilX-like protein
MSGLMPKITQGIESNTLKNESGFAFVVTLLLLTVLSLLVAVGANWSAQDIKRASKYKKSREAFYIAETGIQQAINFFNYDGAGNSPGAAVDGFNQELDGSNWPTAFASTSFGGGTFSVDIDDNDDNDSDDDDDVDHTVVLTSQATKGDQTTSIEAIVNRPTFTPGSAITTKGNLGGSGSFTVQGACGSIHTNSGFNQSGVSGTVTQGTTASGACSGATCTASGAAEHPIPLVDPTDYKVYAKYVLQNDGTIRDTLSTPNDLTDDVVYAKPSSTWVGTPGAIDGTADLGSITRPGGLWKMNGSDLADGIYYVEGDINVLGTPDPFQVTIFSDGYIDFGGNGDIVNYQGGPSPDIDQLFLVAGTDLEFSGTPANQIEGMLYAGEQMSISGTVDINGFIVSANTADVENKVSPESSISGSLTVTYNCNGISPFLSDRVTVLSWQEQ